MIWRRQGIALKVRPLKRPGMRHNLVGEADLRIVLLSQVARACTSPITALVPCKEIHISLFSACSGENRKIICSGVQALASHV